MPVNINFRSGGGKQIDLLKPYKPAALAPKDGAADSALYVRLKLSEYGHPLGIPIGGVHWQIAADSEFASLVYDNRQVTASDSVVVTTDSNTAETYLQQGTEYFWRGRYFDLRESESDWSETRSFSTAADAGTDAIIQPDILNPVNGGHTGESKIFVQLTQPVTIGQVAPDKADFQLSMTPDFADGDILLDKQDVEHTTLIIDDTVNLRDVSAPVYMRARQKDSVRGIVSPYSPVPTIWIQRAFRDMIVGRAQHVKGTQSVLLNIDKDGKTVYPNVNFWNDHPIWGGMVPATYTSTTGNDFSCVRVPGFWHKAETVENGPDERIHRVWVAPYQVDESWYLHPAFVSSPAGLLIGTLYVGVVDNVVKEDATLNCIDKYVIYSAAAWKKYLDLTDTTGRMNFAHYYIRNLPMLLSSIEKLSFDFITEIPRSAKYRGLPVNDGRLGDTRGTHLMYCDKIFIATTVPAANTLSLNLKLGLPASNSYYDFGALSTVISGINMCAKNIHAGFNDELCCYLEILNIPKEFATDASISYKKTYNIFTPFNGHVRGNTFDRYLYAGGPDICFNYAFTNLTYSINPPGGVARVIVLD